MPLSAWPTITDDSGTKTDGTIINKAVFDAVRASVENSIFSSGNPSVEAKTIIDEVITARGTQPALDTRLDVALNENGTPKASAFSAYATVVQAQSLSDINFAQNSDFLLWPDGDTAAPEGFTLSGGGATIARTGTGLGDTTRAKYGDFACLLTFGAAAAVLQQNYLTGTDFTRADGIKGRTLGFGVWAKTSTANQAKLVVSDGTNISTATHTGSGNFEWLSLAHTVSNTGTFLLVQLQVATAGSAYFGNLMGCFSPIAPAHFIPTPMMKDSYYFQIAGAVSTGTRKFRILPTAPGIVTDVQLWALTAPTGAAMILDVNTWSGAADVSMFTTRPQIADGANLGAAAPDGTYARRCFRPTFGTTLATSGAITVDVDQIGSGVAGSDLIIEVRTRRYLRPLEGLLTYTVL